MGCIVRGVSQVERHRQLDQSFGIQHYMLRLLVWYHTMLWLND